MRTYYISAKYPWSQCCCVFSTSSSDKKAPKEVCCICQAFGTVGQRPGVSIEREQFLIRHIHIALRHDTDLTAAVVTHCDRGIFKYHSTRDYQSEQTPVKLETDGASRQLLD